MSPGRAVRLLIAVSAALGCDGAPDRGAATARSHIFLVTADALRADHLSLNGYPRQTSPRIDAFADTAWQFPDAVTPIPKTGPAFTTVLSGMHPRQHGVDANRFAIPDDVPLLPERLAEAGYRTAAFVSNPVLRPSRGYRRGFEHFVLFGEGDGVTLVERSVRGPGPPR